VPVVTRKILAGSLALTPLTLLLHYAFGVNGTAIFILAALSLMPLAWLIGEATEHVAEHTGPGIGGFFNASFGNAPELIIALLAVHNGLPDVVRGSVIGSVVSNLLLVLGFTMIAGREGELDRRSLFLQLGLVLGATLAFFIPAIPSWDGNPDRHSLYVLTLPVAAVLLAVYVGLTIYNLRVHSAEHQEHEPSEGAWSMRTSLVVLAIATIATAFVAETLVGSLEEFGHQLGLSDFFVAVVIVAIVGNAAEHGGAIVVARRGKMKLATEIAVSSAAQVAVFVAPAIAIFSWIVGPGLPLAFRPVELATMLFATIVVGFVVYDGRARRWEGFVVVGAYVACAAAYWISGDR